MDVGKLFSRVARSNLYTMYRASFRDSRQAVPTVAGVQPPADVRVLRARLLLEECLETCQALGVRVVVNCGSAVPGVVLDSMQQIEVRPLAERLDMEDTVDGCCDLIYVATGLLCSMGIPDVPHLDAVCRANNAKFPQGVPVRMDEYGKYLKPDGWVPPAHAAEAAAYVGLNPFAYAEEIAKDPMKRAL
jgi:predicted HAD superfamily Cof-like phosphohydrolase